MTVKDQVRVTSIGMSRRGVTTKERPILAFDLSCDIVDKLFEVHDRLYKPFVYGLPERPDRYKAHRIEFARFRDIGIPAVLIRIEAPTFNPHGSRFWHTHGSRQYRCQILARKLRVRPDIPATVLETMWDEDALRGLICTFPDEYMEFPGEKIHLMPRQKEIPINDRDMVVY